MTNTATIAAAWLRLAGLPRHATTLLVDGSENAALAAFYAARDARDEATEQTEGRCFSTAHNFVAETFRGDTHTDDMAAQTMESAAELAATAAWLRVWHAAWTVAGGEDAGDAALAAGRAAADAALRVVADALRA